MSYIKQKNCEFNKKMQYYYCYIGYELINEPWAGDVYEDPKSNNNVT
jgi:hypothetical protein